VQIFKQFHQRYGTEPDASGGSKLDRRKLDRRKLDRTQTGPDAN